ncbi:hypothetical protein E0Z10_g4862 [Xylaria hypoxylon]|uniref:Dynamin N-terminal domain-containing protein n=1 Tax=Xylaria hypoxylon TaxID=37992 RepID=A0A4Z0YXM9_9PEZI|nr:hypothetical protein E0Z10_g4862 [Xylaria hypoxylon]
MAVLRPRNANVQLLACLVDEDDIDDSDYRFLTDGQRLRYVTTDAYGSSQASSCADNVVGKVWLPEPGYTLVQEIVKTYMMQARAIILAVVSAKNDISNQIVLKLARSCDPDGKRTMGVITKPDFLVPGSDTESMFVSLAENKQRVRAQSRLARKEEDFKGSLIG